MPSTPNFGWPLPEDTAEVASGPAIIRALGDAADSTAGVQGAAVTAVEGRVTVLETVGFRFAGQRIYESTGTFLKADPLGTGDIGLRAIRVTVVGAGGGAGGVPATIGGESGIAGSGGGGAACETFITNIAGLSATETITRGAGGTGGSAGSGGSNGGASSAFGASAPGGIGGEAGTNSTSNTTRGGGDNPGPSGTFGRELFGAGVQASEIVNAGVALGSVVGAPGHSALGGRLGQRRDNQNSDAGVAPGEGARAGAIRANQTARTGASGANGIVIIDCFV